MKARIWLNRIDTGFRGDSLAYPKPLRPGQLYPSQTRPFRETVQADWKNAAAQIQASTRANIKQCDRRAFQFHPVAVPHNDSLTSLLNFRCTEIAVWSFDKLETFRPFRFKKLMWQCLSLRGGSGNLHG